MGTTPSKLPQLELGKLNLVRQRLLQRYEHEPFVSCLAGLYGCQWRRNQRTRAQHGHWCCSKVLSVLTHIILDTHLSKADKSLHNKIKINLNLKIIKI